MAIQQTFEFLAPAQDPAQATATRTLVAPALATKTSGKKTRIAKTPVAKASALKLRAKPLAVKAEPAAVKSVAVKSPTTKPEQLLQQLRGRVHGITTASKHRGKKATFSTGCDAIDQLLPRSGKSGPGLRIDAVNEWVADGDACGAAALSLAIASARLKTGSLVVVADNNHFYPPAAAAVGINPSQIIWVRPTTTADAVWSIDQALRCTGASAVWAFVGAWLDDRDARRFQLAAEIGRTTGFLVRPQSVRGRPTFAEVRFHVAISKEAHAIDSSSPTWTLTLDRCQGSHLGTGTGRQVEVTMDPNGQLYSDQLQMRPMQTRHSQNTSASRMPSHESAAMRLASQLAHPKTSSSANPAETNPICQRERRA